MKEITMECVTSRDKEKELARLDRSANRYTLRVKEEPHGKLA